MGIKPTESSTVDSTAKMKTTTRTKTKTKTTIKIVDEQKPAYGKGVTIEHQDGEQPTPVEAKPTPVEAKPTPAEAKPTPAEAKPTPVEAKPAPAEAKPTPAEAKPAPAEAKPAPKDEPTPAERKEAEEEGKFVAKALAGYTTDSEQESVRDYTMNRVNPKNIMDFMRGYEKEGAPEPFFEQLSKEWGFSSKNDIAADTAQKLADYLEEHPSTENEKQRKIIEGIIAQDDFSGKNAKTLDKIVKNILGDEKSNDAGKKAALAAGALLPGGVLFAAHKLLK